MLVQRRTPSGLLAVERSSDEQSMRRRLKELDPQLRLLRELHPTGEWRWDVVAALSDDQPYVPVCSWVSDDGNPLPLSSGLVDLVVKLRREAAGRRGPDADERNRLLAERRDQDRRDQLGALTEDFRPQLERGRVTVTPGVRARKPYWQRNKTKRRRG